ncbi:MAG TPA: folate-binding protein [Acidobacteriaceae bacterium]
MTTALAAAISAETRLPLVPYHGALTPHSFTTGVSFEPMLSQLDAPQAEIAALLEDAAIHDLGWRRRIDLRGEDCSRWLSGMVTNAVEPLVTGSGAYNLVLNAQGRIQGDALVWRVGERFELEVDSAQYEPLLAHLDHFIIMDDVELAPLSGWTALGLTGPNALAILASVGLPSPEIDLTFTNAQLDGHTIRVNRGYSPVVPRFTLWVEEPNVRVLWDRLISVGIAPVGSSALETLRILEGTPAYGQDVQSRDLAQETSLARALSFTKGCYLGQEIVERVRSRGQVHRHLRQLELFPSADALPAPGTEFQLDGKPAGTLTSAAGVQLHGLRRIFAIGMIRAEAELSERSGAPLDYPGGQARLLPGPPKLTGA